MDDLAQPFGRPLQPGQVQRAHGGLDGGAVRVVRERQRGQRGGVGQVALLGVPASEGGQRTPPHWSFCRIGERDEVLEHIRHAGLAELRPDPAPARTMLGLQRPDPLTGLRFGELAQRRERTAEGLLLLVVVPNQRALVEHEARGLRLLQQEVDPAVAAGDGARVAIPDLGPGAAAQDEALGDDDGAVPVEIDAQAPLDDGSERRPLGALPVAGSGLGVVQPVEQLVLEASREQLDQPIRVEGSRGELLG